MTLDEIRRKVTPNTRVHVKHHESPNYSGWYAVTMIRPEYIALAMRDGGLPLWLTWPTTNHYWINDKALHVPDKTGELVSVVYEFSI